MAYEPQWTRILTREELDDFHSTCARLDPRFAADQRRFYETRTKAQLDALAHGSWQANDGESYMLARSYSALAG